MFKLQITLDRHDARQKLNHWLLPDPPNFSLPSTFKEEVFPVNSVADLDLGIRHSVSF
jgi:hypothetical protein